MKRIRIDNQQETLILIGMIISDRFLRDIQTILDPKAFKSSHARKVSKWCLEHYKETGSAPGVHIQDIFNMKVETDQVDEDEAQMIARTLDRVSSEFDRAKEFNIDFVLKASEKFFGRASIKNLAEELLELAEDDPLEAKTYLESYRPKLLPTAQGIDVFNSPEIITAAIEESNTPLIRMGGALGQLIDGDLHRGGLVAFLGQEKIGKTWLLMEFGFAALRNRLNVAFFQAGDMTEKQQITRMMIRTAQRSTKKKYCGDVLIPVYDCTLNQNDMCDMRERTSDVGIQYQSEETFNKCTSDAFKKKEFYDSQTDNGYIPCDYCRTDRERKHRYRGALWWKVENKKVLAAPDAVRSAKLFSKKMKGRTIRLASYDSDTLTISMIESQLDNWIEQQGFVPDVVIIDYPDIMAPESYIHDFRHQQNSIWIGLRKLSTKYDCLLLVVTQADADAYGKEDLTLKNFSNDKRKYSHVTAFYSLNQTAEEKAQGILRIGTLLAREEEFDTRRHVCVMQCLSIGRAHMGSYFRIKP